VTNNKWIWMASRSILLLWIPSPHSSNRNHRSPVLGLQTHDSGILSVRFRVLPRSLLRILLDIRSLLVHQMDLLAQKMGIRMGFGILRAPILGQRRPCILHPTRTIRQRRDHKGTIRPDDTRPRTAQPDDPSLDLPGRTLFFRAQLILF
jgi:hypothetical protein